MDDTGSRPSQPADDIYDRLADEFRSKIDVRSANTAQVAQAIAEQLPALHPGQRQCEILELGPGSGDLARALSERGFAVTAVESAPRMAELARDRAPAASVITADFMTLDMSHRRFDVVVGVAFLHLFTVSDRRRVLAKIRRLLDPTGFTYLSTTLHEAHEEHWLPKTNFANPLARFRCRFTEGTFRRELEVGGFEVLTMVKVNDTETERIWMAAIARPQTPAADAPGASPTGRSTS